MNNNEWLETDGLGGFASGGSDTIRTRRYHAILLAATTPPTGRLVLVNGFDAWVTTSSGTYAITSQRYNPDVIHPDGSGRIESFAFRPWPTWVFKLDDGTRILQEIFVKKGYPITVVTWRTMNQTTPVTLSLRPFFSGRDYHSMHHENGSFRFDPEIRGQHFLWLPYQGLPQVHVLTNGSYHHDPQWYRNFFYEQEHQRGLDSMEDLASPGTFSWEISDKQAFCIFTTEDLQESPLSLVDKYREEERKRRSEFSDLLESSADAYLAQRKKGKTIVAGYPWFTDWGRDTFIAIRGLCLATGKLDIARDILLEWAETVSEGMLPNRFPDQGGEPEYNSVDASLWYVIAVHDYLRIRHDVPKSERKKLLAAVHEILSGYSKGTRFGIRMDEDALIAAGQPGCQLTWMDAKIGDWVVTPRIGKPVEIQALWINALRLTAEAFKEWKPVYIRATESFLKKFWIDDKGYLYDVIDVDHQPGKMDRSFRPNQIFAVGGLPFPILTGDRARSVVESVEKHLWTPLGLRSLTPESPDYASNYEGGPRERDSVYHQGTVWPWLTGAFVEAWLRVHSGTAEAKDTARTKYLAPLLKHLTEAGLGHISEIADAEPPFTPRGCPFQAWSVSEAIRVAKLLNTRT